ncbi:hypothetical protein NE237_026105 [Protea cynaroides]|uniref:Uncharacterized protein n=1 Tax=Protea cynaroides TaxID=273540 RepID=A0A9Q0H4D8_9MAGN|nr:hypothetical protein NE237_026105 [Protea cynaroides]
MSINRIDNFNMRRSSEDFHNKCPLPCLYCQGEWLLRLALPLTKYAGRLAVTTSTSSLLSTPLCRTGSTSYPSASGSRSRFGSDCFDSSSRCLPTTSTPLLSAYLALPTTVFSYRFSWGTVVQNYEGSYFSAGISSQRRVCLLSGYFFSGYFFNTAWRVRSPGFLIGFLLHGVFFSTAWRLSKFFSRFKMSVCKVVYHYENRSQPKVLDSDLYSYIDVIYDIYNSVLRHIPEEKSISFKVKCVMEDIDVEMEIDSDGKMQKMFQVNQQGSEFHLHVYDVNVFDEYPNAINGYSKTIMDRKGRFNMMGVNVDQNVGKRRIQKTLARRFVSEPRTISEPRDKEATHVHEVQVVPVSEPRVVETVETVEESCGNQSSTDDAEWTDSGEED